jgi:hypothetical protein
MKLDMTINIFLRANNITTEILYGYYLIMKRCIYLSKPPLLGNNEIEAG